MIKKYLTLFTSLSLIIACTSSDRESGSGNTGNFDREALLINVADNIIIPAFKDLNNKLIILKASTANFTNTPEIPNLEQVRFDWYQAYKVWQHVSMFNIGKGEDLQLVNHFNIYPLTVKDVENNITSGFYDFNNPNNHDAQGFPALDYLLHSIGSNDMEIIKKYTTDSNADRYKKYLDDIAGKMNSVVSEIVNDWESGFRNEFIKNTSNTITGSLNKLVNDFILYYEKRLRANKFGIPAGNFSSKPLPEKVEALYKQDVSKELALEGLTSVQNFFQGRAYNGTATGESLKTYLVSLNKSSLGSDIINQLNRAENQINQLDDNFYNQINTDNTKMTRAYDELQKAVVLLKVDMLQAFNINVDFVDADGD